MNAFKRLIFVPLLALIACAPPKMQAPLMPGAAQNGAAPAQTAEQSASDKGTIVVTNDKTKADLSSSKRATPPTSWELSGAMAAKNKSKAWSASVNWIQRGINSYQIRLFGPLGSGTVMISRQGGAVSFRDGPKSVTSSNADELLSKQTGVRLPVSSLFYWVRGLPAPGAVQSAQRDGNNNLVLLRQSGYTIQYLGYSRVGNLALPSSIRLQGNGVFIKMVIKRWRI